MFATPGGIISDHHAFAVRGDTLINSMAYKKLYYQDFAPGPAYLLEEEHLWGVVRDDSLERKVYVIAFEPYAYGYHCPVDEEQLLFDFSILPGDSTAHCQTVGDYPWILDSTYVSYKYSANRRTLFTVGWLSTEIYEGIGSDNGLFGTSYQIQGDDEYWLHEYCIGSDEDCGIISGTNAASIPEIGVLLYPNPATSQIQIDFTDSANSNYRLRITNSMGKVFLDETLPYWASAYTVSVTDWPPGVYFVQYLADRVFWRAERLVVY